MKIAAISPNKQHLQEISRVLEANSHSVMPIDGGKSKMRQIADEEQPDLLIVDGMCTDISELAQVEYVTTHYPNTAVILLCSVQTPEFLINSMRAGVREVLPSPVTADALAAAVNRIVAKRDAARGNDSGKVLSFMACKGGSGATFLASNFGYQLAESKTVLLIDLNLQFGDALSFVYESKPQATIADVARDISRLDASLLSASTVKATPNYSILAAPEDPSHAMEIKPEHIDAILKVAVTQYNFVLVDVPRALEPMSIKALDRSDKVFLVLQNSIPDIRNASKLLAVFKSLDYPIQKIELIVNRFEKRGDIDLNDMRRTLGSHALHTMPNSFKEVSTSINHGNPILQMARTNTVTRHLAEFAQALNPRQEEPRSMLARLFKRA